MILEYKKGNTMKKENLVQLMSKYNARFVSVVDVIDNSFGSFLVGNEHIYFNVRGDGALYVYDIVNKDNIDMYYEFMSDDDTKKHIHILKPIFQDRWCKLNQFFGGSIIASETLFNDNTMLPDSVFGARDTLKPINEYIADIKNSWMS